MLVADRRGAQGDVGAEIEAKDGGAEERAEISPGWIQDYRDDLLGLGYGPASGPPVPDREPDYFFHPDPQSGSPCWRLDSGVWCLAAPGRWGVIAVTDGRAWAAAPLNGGPACTYNAHWWRPWDFGNDAFGGTATCPGDPQPDTRFWHVVIVN